MLICKNGISAEGNITITLERGNKIILFKEVPADICTTCGEEYVSSETTQKVLNKAEEIMNSGVMFEIRQFVA